MAMNFWECALLAAAAYVAVVTLVRLMQSRRDQLIDELSRQAEVERERRRAEERNEKRRKMREQMRKEEAKNRRAA